MQAAYSPQAIRHTKSILAKKGFPILPIKAFFAQLFLPARNFFEISACEVNELLRLTDGMGTRLDSTCEHSLRRNLHPPTVFALVGFCHSTAGELAYG